MTAAESAKYDHYGGRKKKAVHVEAHGLGEVQSVQMTKAKKTIVARGTG